MAKKVMEVVDKTKQISNKAIRKATSGKWKFERAISRGGDIQGYLTKGSGEKVISKRAKRISNKK